LPPAAAGLKAKARAGQAAAAGTKWHLDLAIGIGLVLSVLAVYAQVGHFFFITFDDPFYVTENLHVQSGLTPESIRWALTAVVDSNWVPLTMLSHMAVCALFGLESGMHHWANVVFHALGAVLLFAGLRRATGVIWPSAFVAFVFALHPLHVESVAWVSERKDVLSTVFWFLALYAYVRYSERPSRGRYFQAMVLFCLGLTAKPMLVTFPFTLLLLDVWPLRRTQLPRTLWEKIPFFAISAAFGVLVYLVQSSGGAVQAVPLGERVPNSVISYVGYIGQTFWPTGLAMYYPYRGSVPAWQVGGAFAILFGVTALAVVAWRKRPYIATGWFWYLGTLIPVIGLVQAGEQAHADRYMYVPMVGLSIIVAWGASDVVRKWPQAKFAVASAAVVGCLVCLAASSAQAEYWRDSETLYRRALSVTENNYLVQFNLGDYLLNIPGRSAEAASHFEAALRLRPDSARAHNGLGVCLLQSGHEAEAIAQFEAALRTPPPLAAAHFNLGSIYSNHPGRELDAVAEYEAALRAQPDLPQAHKNLGGLLLKLGRKSEAISHFEAALRSQPDPEIVGILEELRAH
jgi:Tfp pilus assembly protein PilF